MNADLEAVPVAVATQMCVWQAWMGNAADMGVSFDLVPPTVFSSGKFGFGMTSTMADCFQSIITEP